MEPIFDPDIKHQQIRALLAYWVVIPAAVILSGLCVDRLLRLPRLPWSWALVIFAGILLGCGLWLIQRSTSDLARYGGGTPSPFRPAKRLVTEGSYRLCRHPMFLGYDCAALGVVLLCCSPAMLLLSYPVMLVWQVRFLRREERVLVKRFRDEYPMYKRRVSFLLPWF